LKEREQWQVIDVIVKADETRPADGQDSPIVPDGLTAELGVWKRGGRFARSSSDRPPSNCRMAGSGVPGRLGRVAFNNSPFLTKNTVLICGLACTTGASPEVVMSVGWMPHPRHKRDQGDDPVSSHAFHPGGAIP
jgi:hypothetical protein